MVKIGLKFKATLENLTNLRPDGEDFRWYLKVKCGSCNEVSDKWIYITQSESNDVKGGRGTANLVVKCKLCSRENNMDIIPESLKTYNDEDQNKFKTIVQFDCRGMEPSDFSPRNGWLVDGLESGTKFNDVDLSDKEWVEYDEKAKNTVGIYEVEHQFGREK
nr:EOG090X0HQJ [Simocephalus serrulatus]